MDKRDFREEEQRGFSTRIAEDEERKLRARQRGEKSIWFGLGMFGMIGWSVAVPTFVGIAVGIWIDRRWPGGFSWTLMLLFVGLLLGCLIAYHWVNRERKTIERERKNE
jgi:ATP synthase protein I